MYRRDNKEPLLLQKVHCVLNDDQEKRNQKTNFNKSGLRKGHAEKGVMKLTSLGFSFLFFFASDR